MITQIRNLILEKDCNCETFCQVCLRMFFADPRVKLSEHEGLANATLRIEDIDFDDRAVYMCSATNEFGVGNNTVMVRVKGEYRRNLWLCCRKLFRHLLHKKCASDIAIKWFARKSNVSLILTDGKH